MVQDSGTENTFILRPERVAALSVLLSGFSRLENSAVKGMGRDGGSLRFLNPCCDQVLFAVAVPTVIDRIIQQAMLQQLMPIYERLFSDDSFGYRPGRGAKDAIFRNKRVH